jgi:hypothetical protein
VSIERCSECRPMLSGLAAILTASWPLPLNLRLLSLTPGQLEDRREVSPLPHPATTDVPEGRDILVLKHRGQRRGR